MACKSAEVERHHAGNGVTYTNYATGDDMVAVRATGTLGISRSDMVLLKAAIR